MNKLIALAWIVFSLFVLTSCSSSKPITNFEECVAAGNLVMESYPEKCRDPISDKTFTREIESWKLDGITLMQHSAEGYFGCFGCGSAKDGQPAICIDPIMEMKLVEETAQRYCNEDFEVVEINNNPATCGNNICEDQQFVVCKDTITGFDPEKYAKDNNGICVDSCPEKFDPFTTQIGIQLCIPHYGEKEIEAWETCEKSSDTCNCVKAYETTDEKQIEDAEYRCVPEDYAERLVFRAGIDRIDENGEQSVMIA